jgi:hypothetical protein
MCISETVLNESKAGKKRYDNNDDGDDCKNNDKIN